MSTHEQERAKRVLESVGKKLQRAHPVREQKTKTGMGVRLSAHAQETAVTIALAPPWNTVTITATNPDWRFSGTPAFRLDAEAKRRDDPVWAEGVYQTKGPRDLIESLPKKVLERVGTEFRRLGIRRIRLDKQGSMTILLNCPGFAAGQDLPNFAERIAQAATLAHIIGRDVLTRGYEKRPRIFVRGVPLEQLVKGMSSREEARVVCQYCGSKVLARHESCPNCGAPLP